MLIMLLLPFIKAWGQLLQPAHWSYASKKINDKEAVVLLKATLDPGWHLYSQKLEPGGPLKTQFAFATSPAYQLSGKTAEPRPIKQFEKAFNQWVLYFEREVVFQQRITLRTPTATVRGKVEYMVCNNQKCLPPDEVKFSIPVQ
jgi:DsbC/DsbD-like thiol-disulfide interchange protein